MLDYGHVVVDGSADVDEFVGEWLDGCGLVFGCEVVISLFHVVDA